MKYLDCVKIVKLLKEKRDFDGTKGVMRSPAIGDTGTIVEVYRIDQKNAAYCVESINNEGYTIWLADFLPEEIHPID